MCVGSARRKYYHPAAWAARRWLCCDAERRLAQGCALAEIWTLLEPLGPLSLQDKCISKEVARTYLYIHIHLLKILVMYSENAFWTKLFNVNNQFKQIQ